MCENEISSCNHFEIFYHQIEMEKHAFQTRFVTFILL